MLKVSQLMRIPVYRPRRGKDGEPSRLEAGDLRLVGNVRQVVFAPTGDRVVGLLVRRPDVAGMVKRQDAFLALDSFAVSDEGLVLKREDGLDDAARERLGLDWDACVLWTGMDAKTTDGTELGWVNDVEFSPKDGSVSSFFVGDGRVAESLVGDVVIPAAMLRGYADGFMLVDPEAQRLSLNGGLAAKAGESYARAKESGRKAAEKGAYGLGRMLGKARQASTGTSAGTGQGAKRAGKEAKGKKSAREDVAGNAAKALGRQLGRTRGMFGSFMDEYKKASK